MDMDPQAHASKTLAGGVFGRDDEALGGEEPDEKATLGDLLLGDSPLPATAIIETSSLPQNGRGNLDYLPTQKSSLNVATRVLTSEPDGQFRLDDLIRPLQPLYEYIIVDTPPNLGVMTINSLLAATHVVIPLTCRPSPWTAWWRPWTPWTASRTTPGSTLAPVVGISPVKCNFRRHEQQEWLETLNDRYGDLVLPSIGDRGDVHSAQTQGLDIFSYKPPRESSGTWRPPTRPPRNMPLSQRLYEIELTGSSPPQPLTGGREYGQGQKNS